MGGRVVLLRLPISAQLQSNFQKWVRKRPWRVGKLVSKEDPARGLTQEDLARALLSLVTNNIGQVAYLNAKLHKTPRIYFVGSFLRHNMISQRRLSYAIDYWSKGEMEALFLEHEGYFGALGAFLMTQNIENKADGFFQWKDHP